MTSNKEDTDMGEILHKVWCAALDSQADNYVVGGKVGKIDEEGYIEYQKTTLDKATHQIKSLFLDTLNTKLDGLDMGEMLDDATTHYERVCLNCGWTWLGLHCPHDGYQNPCPICKTKPEQVIQTHDDRCKGVTDLPEATHSIKSAIRELLSDGGE